MRRDWIAVIKIAWFGLPNCMAPIAAMLPFGNISGFYGPRHIGDWWQTTFPINPMYSWVSYQIRKFAGCACVRNAVNIFPTTARKPLVSDPAMHHGRCITHVPWCMSGSLTRGGGETFPAFPVHAQPAIIRTWQAAHALLDWCSWVLSQEVN